MKKRVKVDKETWQQYVKMRDSIRARLDVLKQVDHLTMVKK